MSVSLNRYSPGEITAYQAQLRYHYFPNPKYSYGRRPPQNYSTTSDRDRWPTWPYGRESRRSLLVLRSRRRRRRRLVREKRQSQTKHDIGRGDTTTNQTLQQPRKGDRTGGRAHVNCAGRPLANIVVALVVWVAGSAAGDRRARGNRSAKAGVGRHWRGR